MIGAAAGEARGLRVKWGDDREAHAGDVRRFRDAAEQVGIQKVDDFNRGDNAGCSYFEVNQKRGIRWNTAKAFLRPTCYGRPNFEMWTSAHAAKLIVETQPDGRKRCTGVQVWDGQQMVTARATGEVILCAGAVNSPQLLQLSGIGPAALLRQYGIDVVHDLPGVGANLQDHLQIRAVFKVQGVQTLNTMANSLVGKAKIGLEYALKRSGPMSMAPSQLGAFTRSSPDQPYPNIEYHVQPLSLDAFGEPLHSFPAFTASVCNLNPTSPGTVNIKSADFKAAPAIAPNYLSTPEDRQVAADAIRTTRRLMKQKRLERYHPVEYLPGPEVGDDDASLAKAAGDIGTTIFHPVGTAKMGMANDPMAVVDERLRFYGIEALRVVDASVMPTITSGNTNTPTAMIAEKGAAMILEDGR